MEEAVRRANDARVILAPNKRLSEAFGTNEWFLRSMGEVLAFWSGTMVGYDEPYKKLGETIEYTDDNTGIKYIFPVPQEHRGKTNIALVAEQPFTLEIDKNNRIVHAEEVGVVPEFPAAKTNKEWYRGDERYDIPTGEEVSIRDRAARLLWRIEKRVGLVSRFDHFYDGPFRVPETKVVCLSAPPSIKFGVATENPAVSESVCRTPPPSVTAAAFDRKE